MASDAVEGAMDQVRAEGTVVRGLPDGDLVAGARSGDREAFDRLMARHLEPAFRTAMAILGHEADARDATQEIFVRTWRDLPALRDVERFEAWFGRIVVNTSRSALRGRRRARVREIPVASLGDAAEPTPDPSVGHLEERTAELDMLERAFERLSIDERSLLVLHHLEHRALAEISEMLGIPVGTAKSRLHAARRSLGRALEIERR